MERILTRVYSELADFDANNAWCKNDCIFGNKKY